jgi:hypothetical protein
MKSKTKKRRQLAKKNHPAQVPAAPALPLQKNTPTESSNLKTVAKKVCLLLYPFLCSHNLFMLGG